jgi:ferredoxin
MQGFISSDGGISVVSNPHDIDCAEMAAQFCPQQVISMEVVDE